MNKPDLIAAVAAKTGVSKHAAEMSVNSILDTITEALAAGESVNIVGFGAFSVKDRAARTGRNPRTGEEVSVPAFRAPVFKAGKGLKDAVKTDQ